MKPQNPSHCDPDKAESPRRVLGTLALTVLGLYLMLSPVNHFVSWRAPSTNVNIMEAIAWRDGRLHLLETPAESPRHRPMDTAFVDGRVYNIFPPLMSVFAYSALTLQSWQGMDESYSREADGPGVSSIYPPWYVLFTFWPLPFAAFWAARESILAHGQCVGAPTTDRSGDRSHDIGATGSRLVVTPSIGAAIVTAYLMLGTPLTRLLHNCQSAAPNELNHVLSCTGLLLIAGDLVHRRRMWPAVIGLIIGLWSRQLTIFYLGAMLWLVVVAWRKQRRALMGGPASTTSTGAEPLTHANVIRRGLLAAAIVVIIGGGALATLNTLKFGHPLDSGYAAIYAGREKDLYASRWMRYQHLFDLRFVPENAYWMNLAPPTVEWRPMTILINGEGDGTSIWITCPLLLLAFVAVRSWWSDPARRGLMLASLCVIFGFLCYHNTGSLQRGYHRFSMDFVPIWLIVIAPFAVTRRALPYTLACLAYSALYFHLLVRS